MYLTMLGAADIEYGTRVTELLKLEKVPFNGSLWIFMTNAGEWRLMIATPLVDQIGPAKTYQRLITALKNVRTAESADLLRRLWVVSPKEKLYKALRGVFGKAKDVTGMRISNSSVEGIPIEDSYFYQVR